MDNRASGLLRGSVESLPPIARRSPPYLHDDRLITLDDTVEFFNLVLGLRLTAQEKQDIVAFMRAL